MRLPRCISVYALATVSVLAAPPAPEKKPKLVLAIVIDQFRYDYLLRFGNDYHYGLSRLTRQGAVFTDAHYLHATTVTAVGHSTFLSGAPPAVSGIVGNEWFDRKSGKTVTSVFDPQTQLVGGAAGPGSSPHRLMVSTVADELKIQGEDSRVIGVSIKDRGAILPAGHMADAAYWYDDESGHWVTSTFYRKELPEWAAKINDENPAHSHMTEQWFPIDAKPGSAKPFCSMVKGGAAPACGNLEATPWGNEMIEAFAERAVVGENLGHHAGVDVLTVSFSSNDYVGHAVGPDHAEVRDMSLRTDRLLGKLLDYVDQRVGAGNTLVVLTADHGVAPVPEVNQARKMPGGRIQNNELTQAMTDALTKRFGAGKWFLSSAAGNPYLNTELIATKKLEAADVQRVAADAALTIPHIARAYTRHELETGSVQQDSIGRSITLSFFGGRSGDVYIVQDPYYLFGATGTSHGTPYGYDTHVPVIFMGAQIKPGVYTQAVAPNDIAPTLAELLGVEAPSGSIGRVLSMMFR